MRRAAFPATTLALVSLWGSGSAADEGEPSGGVGWISDVQSRSRPPTLRRPVGQSGQLAYAGVRVPLEDGEYRVRLIAAESVLEDGLQQRSSFGSSVDLYYDIGDDRSFALALERLDNTHPADQAGQDFVSYAARGFIGQRLRGTAAPELRLHTGFSSELNRRGNHALSGVTATALAEIVASPAPAWEVSFGLSGESARFREPAAEFGVARNDRYGGVVLAAEHALSPVSRLRCEAEAGMMRSTDQPLDGPQRLLGCSVRIEL
jgi:hypothetical protein